MKTILQNVTMLTIILAMPAHALDLSNYDSMYVRVTQPTDSEGPKIESFLAGILVTKYRGTGQFSHVGEMTEDVSSGVLIEADISNVYARSFAKKHFLGAFSGTDRVEGQVRLIDITTGDVLADADLSEDSSYAFLFTVKSSNISAATENFANSLIVWSGHTPEGFGKPTRWDGVLDRSNPVSIMCTGFEINFYSGKYSYNNRSDSEVCAVLDENLTMAGIRVAASSPIKIHLQHNAVGFTDTGGRSIEKVMVLRWQITNSGETSHNDIAVARHLTKGGFSAKKRIINNNSAALKKSIRKGISAFFPETVWPEEDK